MKSIFKALALKILDLRFEFFSVFLALLLPSVLLWCVGESPFLMAEALKNSLTSFGLGYSLFYSTFFLLTGLSCALCFRGGLFNIGAEGQLYMGCLFVIFFVSLFPNLPPPFSWLGAGVAALLGGGIAGGTLGLLKSKRQVHEVLASILSNFIIINLVNYFILHVFRNPDSQNVETFFIPKNYELVPLSAMIPAFESTPVNLSLLLAIGLCFFCYYLLFLSPFGFRVRAVGENIVTSHCVKIKVHRVQIVTFFLGGALAGLVGLNEVLGHQHRLIEGFSPQYGFTGIAVSLLAKNNPIGILASSFLFGVLQNSSREIEFLSSKMSKEIVFVIQAILLGSLSLRNLWREKK